jgi:hypothetical protein
MSRCVPVNTAYMALLLTRIVQYFLVQYQGTILFAEKTVENHISHSSLITGTVPPVFVWYNCSNNLLVILLAGSCSL